MCPVTGCQEHEPPVLRNPFRSLLPFIHIHSFETLPPFEGAPTPIQDSRPVIAIPFISATDWDKPVNRRGGCAPLSPNSIRTLQQHYNSTNI